MILVTGGAGFIGSNYVRHWLAHKNEKIINLDKLTYAGNLSSLKSVANDKNHIFIKGDIADNKTVHDILQKYKPRAVINFAAESHVDNSISDPEAFVVTNVLGTLRLLENAKKFFNNLESDLQNSFRFIHVSTDEVFGSLNSGDKPFNENNPYLPNSPYSASKASSDHFVRAYFQTYGFPTIITNCSNNYGPFQHPEKLIPLIIINALANKELPIYGDGNQIRDWLFVDDHCSAIRSILERGVVGQTYNIGGDAEKSNISVVEEICECLDSLVPKSNGLKYNTQIRFVKDRLGHDRRYAVDARKIRKEIGWKPNEDFSTGIRKTVVWYLENTDWIESIS